MKIKQSVINTFSRVGIPYEELLKDTEPRHVENRFGGGACDTSLLVAHCIAWVYMTNDKLDRGDRSVTIADFDRVRYFILDADQNAYMTCID